MHVIDGMYLYVLQYVTVNHIYKHIPYFRYAENRVQTLQQQNLITRRSKWSPVTMSEILGFLAIILNMGLIHLPEIEDYWKTSWVSEVPFFPRVISRDRFEMIFSMLHIGKIQDNQPCQKIDKVKPLLDLLIPTFQQSYDVYNAIAIDETMVGFRGSFAGKQYMPTKWGGKAFTMATGFMINILPYMGAETLCNANPSFAHLPQPA